MDSIIQGLREFLLTCPYLGRSKINIDYLPEDARGGVEYSIDTTPATQIVKQYTDGSSIRQHLFVIRSVKAYGADTLQNISNSGAYEKISDWLEGQTRSRNLPDLPEGKTAQRIEAQSTSYLAAMGPDVGKYQIQCRLLYLQEE